MNIYEVRIGDVARNVAARTPTEAATAAVREHGFAAFRQTYQDETVSTWTAIVDVVGHGPHGAAFTCPHSLDTDGFLDQSMQSSAPPWERPLVGEPWPVGMRGES